jgi:hypothetical protein
VPDCFRAIQETTVDRSLFEGQSRVVEAERLLYVTKPGHLAFSVVLGHVLGRWTPMEVAGEHVSDHPVNLRYEDVAPILRTFYTADRLDVVTLESQDRPPLSTRIHTVPPRGASTGIGVTEVIAPDPQHTVLAWNVPLSSHPVRDWTALELLARALTGPYAPPSVGIAHPELSITTHALPASILWTVGWRNAAPGRGPSAIPEIPRVPTLSPKVLRRASRHWANALSQTLLDPRENLLDCVWLKGCLVSPGAVLGELQQGDVVDALYEVPSIRHVRETEPAAVLY